MTVIDADETRREKWFSAYSDIVEMTRALLAATLVLAVFMMLAAIDPVTWTLQSNLGSHLRGQLWTCLNIEDDAARLACYDGVARQPAPQPGGGANIPRRLFEKQKRP